MKILQLAPQFPFPEDEGGKIGLASTFRQLSRQADVTFFCYSKAKPTDDLIRYAEQYGKVIVHEHSTQNTPFRIFKSIFQKEPLYLSKHQNNEAFLLLKGMVLDDKFDIIHADHTAMAPLALALHKLSNIPCGLRLHNVEHLIWNRYEQVLPNYHPKRWYVSNQAKKLKKSESKLLEQFSVCFPITDTDAKITEYIAPIANIVTAGPGINLQQWQPEDLDRKSETIIHATTYDWVHNIDAVRWFIKEVMTKLHKINPKITLQLLGKYPPSDYFDYKNIGVDVLGFVPSVKPYLNAAGIYAAPLFVGGGIRLKILEAMAMEIPVVASSVSAEGIHGTRENGLIIAESADDFINEIIYLVDNPEIARKLGQKARKYVLENYTWEKSIVIIYKTYQQLLEKQ